MSLKNSTFSPDIMDEIDPIENREVKVEPTDDPNEGDDEAVMMEVIESQVYEPFTYPA